MIVILIENKHITIDFRLVISCKSILHRWFRETPKQVGFQDTCFKQVPGIHVLYCFQIQISDSSHTKYSALFPGSTSNIHIQYLILFPGLIFCITSRGLGSHYFWNQHHARCRNKWFEWMVHIVRRTGAWLHRTRTIELILLERKETYDSCLEVSCEERGDHGWFLKRAL